MQSSTENRERLTHECLDVLSQIMESSLSTCNTYHMLCKVLANQIVQNTRSELISLKSFKELVLWLQCFIGKCRTIYEQSQANEKLTISLKKNLQELTATLQHVDLKNFPNQLIPNLIAVFCSCYFVNPCENKARAWIESVSSNYPNKWNLYQVARNLVRYGMYAEAKPLLKDIHSECRSSRSLNWIAILLHICDAESIISDSENRDFDIALESYQCALRVISSYPTKLANQEFQRTFLRLRSEFLDVCSQVQKWVFMGKLFSFDEFDGPQKLVKMLIRLTVFFQWSSWFCDSWDHALYLFPPYLAGTGTIYSNGFFSFLFCQFWPIGIFVVEIVSGIIRKLVKGRIWNLKIFWIFVFSRRSRLKIFMNIRYLGVISFNFSVIFAKF